MAADFRFTGEVLIANVVTTGLKRQIQNALKNITAPIRVKFDTRTAQRIGSLDTSVASLSKSMRSLANNTSTATAALANFNAQWQRLSSQSQRTVRVTANVNQAIARSAGVMNQATDAATAWGKSSAIALRRYSAFLAGSRVVFGLLGAIADATKNAIEFERQMIKVSQVTGSYMGNLTSLTKTLKSLAALYGTNNQELVGVSRILSQAGLSANETDIALKTLAKTTLAATFTDINKTTEGSIAIMNQFKIGVQGLDNALGSVNAVAGKFAVESDDIIAAVRRTGSVFANAANSSLTAQQKFEQFIATFSAVRATTRESAESIATGLRTITTRIQRFRTIKFLQGFGIDLVDQKGKFVGIYEAIDKLNSGLRGIINSGNDLRAVQIAQEIAGYRQIGKVLPLLMETTKRTEALTVAQRGQKSLNEDAEKALKGVGVQLQQVREDFKNLILEIVNTNAFKNTITVLTSFAHSLISVTRALEPLVPLITLLGAVRLGSFGIGFGRSFAKNLPGFADGGQSSGVVKGKGTSRSDSNLVRLSNGEYVINAKSTRNLGRMNLDYMNKTGKLPIMKAARGGYINGYATGGSVGAQASETKFLQAREVQLLSGGKDRLRVDAEIDHYRRNISYARQQLQLSGKTQHQTNVTLRGYTDNLLAQVKAGEQTLDLQKAKDAGIKKEIEFTKRASSRTKFGRRRGLFGSSNRLGRFAAGAGTRGINPLTLLLASGALLSTTKTTTSGGAAGTAGLTGALGGGIIGAQLGSLAGPVGTLVGGATGALYGGATSARSAYLEAESSTAMKALSDTVKRLTNNFSTLDTIIKDPNGFAKILRSTSGDISDVSKTKLSKLQSESSIYDFDAGFSKLTESLSSSQKQDASINAATKARTGFVRSEINAIRRFSPAAFMFGESDTSYQADYKKNRRSVEGEFAQSIKQANEPVFKLLQENFVSATQRGGAGSIGRLLGMSIKEGVASAGNLDTRLVVAREYATTQQQLDIAALEQDRTEAIKSGDTQGITKAEKALRSYTVAIINANDALRADIEQMQSHTRLAQLIDQTAKKLRFFSDEFQKAGARATYIATIATDPMRAAKELSVTRAGGNLGTFGRIADQSDILSNLSGASTASVSRILGTLPISDTLRKSVMASKTLGGRLGDILSDVLSVGNIGNQEPTSELVKTRLSQSLAGSGIVLPEPIQRQINQQIENTFRGNGEFDPSNLKNLTDAIQKPLKEAVQAAITIAKASLKIRNEFLKSLETISTIQTQALVTQAQSDRSFIELNNRKIKSLFGRQLTLQENISPLVSQGSRLLGGTAFGGGNLVSAGDALQRLHMLRGQQTNLRNQISGGRNVAGAGTMLAANVREQQNIANYLKLMASDTSRIVALEQQQVILDTKRTAGRNQLFGMLGASPQEIAKQRRDVGEVIRFQMTNQLPIDMARQRALKAGLDIVRPQMDPQVAERLTALVAKQLAGPSAVGNFALAGTMKGGSVQERGLQSQFDRIVSGMKEAATALRNIQTQELKIAAQNVYLQYGGATEALNREIPQYGKDRAGAVTQIQMGGNLNVNINGLEALKGLEPKMQQIAMNVVLNELGKHFDMTTGEPKDNWRNRWH